MAYNIPGISAATRNTDYFAVVDKLYKPSSGEKVFDINGRRILVKNPEALENFKDMAAFWHRFAEKIFFPIRSLLYQDPDSSIIKYKFDMIDLITEIEQNAHDKMRRRPANRDIDFSVLTFDDEYELFIGENPHNVFLDVFNEYEEDLKKFGPESEQIKTSIMNFKYELANAFQSIVAVYSYCLTQYGYNIYTPYKINNGKLDFTVMKSVFKLFLKIMCTNPFEDKDGYNDMVTDLICLDPYFMGTWVFRHMIEYSYDDNGEIRNAVTLLDPAFATKWNDYIIKEIDQDVEIPFSYDKEKLLADLLELEKSLKEEHEMWCLPENVVSPKLREVREKIKELEWDKEHKADLKQFTEEARKTSKYGEKNRTIAMLLLIFGGFFGAHKFYEGRIGMGILYCFTMGLFVIGLIIDFIVLFEMPEKYIPGQKYHK